MLKIGTELTQSFSGMTMKHVIDAVRIREDGTALYRPAPYQTWYTEGEIRAKFDFVHPPKNTWWERLAANLKRFGEIMETPVGK